MLNRLAISRASCPPFPFRQFACDRYCGWHCRWRNITWSWIFVVPVFSFQESSRHSQACVILLKRDARGTWEKAPSQVLGYLRQAAKAYVSYVPGAGFLVDRTFDAIDDAVDAHTDEANTIIRKAYDDILNVVQRDGNNHKTSSAVEILSITRRLLKELKELGVKSKSPGVSQALGGVAEKANNLVKSSEVSETAGGVAEGRLNIYPLLNIHSYMG
ncbi:hypothetical protein BDZ97DRAFT_1334661 [Flammula alnicola]|nr:hypothetical protein BDZ97DRAFT_1334661 [Flammula alnicola]